KALHLNGLLIHWQGGAQGGWVPALLGWGEEERARRSLERRVGEAPIGRLQPLRGFDLALPKSCDPPAGQALSVLELEKFGFGRTFLTKWWASLPIARGAKP